MAATFNTVTSHEPRRHWWHRTLSLCQTAFVDPTNSLRWRHNERDSVSNHQPHDCLLNRWFTRRSKKTSKLRVTGLCVGNSPETGEFPAQRASNAENGSIWWRHHVRQDCHHGNSRFSYYYVVMLFGALVLSHVTRLITRQFVRTWKTIPWMNVPGFCQRG